MKELVSIAVYNPQDAVGRCIQVAYHAVDGRWLTMGETLAVGRSLISHFGLAKRMRENGEAATADIFRPDGHSNRYIPCFQAELRDILRTRKIVGPYDIAAFTGVACRRLLNDYDTVIIVDPKRLPKPDLDLAGLLLYGHELDLGESVVRVLTRHRLDSPAAAAAMRIVAEEYPSAEIFADTEVPGIAFPKVAQIAPRRRFVVNIPALGIHNDQHNADSDVEAVQNALNKVFQGSHREAQYTAQYWQSSGFWNMIVREIGPANSTAMQVNELNLTDAERRIFETLLAINNENSLGLTFRVAGGWVRDKLLNKQSDDLDITLDKMTGADFGRHVLAKTGRHGNLIKANPDQSKHLETLTVNLFGQDVDFVNLRNEKYADSRIPEMKFGSAEEDALRRDLTINALFFNINKWAAKEDPIEDLTGKGLADLFAASLSLRTPLEPKQTFLDDPLRMLRMLRFASRFPNSAVDVKAIAAMSDPEVQQALKNKVSPERVLSELYGICRGKQPEFALKLLYQSKLWDNVLKPATMAGFHDFKMDQRNPHHIDDVLEHTLKVVAGYNQLLIEDGADDDERAKCVLAAFLHDVGKLSPDIIVVKTASDGSSKQTYKGHDLLSGKVTRELLGNLRAATEDIDTVANIVDYHMLAHDDVLDKTLRKLIRNLGRPLVRRIMQHGMADASSKPGANVSHYQTLISRVETIAESAPTANVRRPVLSGEVLMPKFPALQAKSGFLRDIQARLQELKDENPELTDDQAFAAVEVWRAEIESKYGSWYEQLKTAGADRICGRVIKRVTELYDPEPKIVLETTTTRYKLRMATDGGEEELEKLLGKSICALGLSEGDIFVISQYSMYNPHTDPAQVKMEREKPSEMTEFKEGDRVRKRKGGLAFNQIEGKVERIHDGLMYVRWNGINDPEVFRLTDTALLHASVQKI